MPVTTCEPEDAWPLIRAFHYSGRMPANIQKCFALRDDGGLFGDFGQEIEAVAIFSIPPTRWSEPVMELTRLVRKPDCTRPLSSLIAGACGLLRRRTDAALLVSFADWTQQHHGGIYQACGWRYAGCRERRMDGVIIDGRFHPGRSCNSRWGTRSPSKLATILRKPVEPHFDEGKHLYWRALNVAGKTRAKRLGLASLPYPKPAAGLVDERAPVRASEARTLDAAPILGVWKER